MGKENITEAKGDPAVGSTALLAAMKTTGFKACEYGGVCEKCGKVSATLYFGNPDYWDCREGDTWCGQCVIDRHTTNEQDYASAVGGQDNTKCEAQK